MTKRYLQALASARSRLDDGDPFAARRNADTVALRSHFEEMSSGSEPGNRNAEPVIVTFDGNVAAQVGMTVGLDRRTAFAFHGFAVAPDGASSMERLSGNLGVVDLKGDEICLVVRIAQVADLRAPQHSQIVDHVRDRAERSVAISGRPPQVTNESALVAGHFDRDR